jgi:hypothetical protein
LASRQAVDFGTELPILKGKQGVPGSAVSPWSLARKADKVFHNTPPIGPDYGIFPQHGPQGVILQEFVSAKDTGK